MVAEIIFSKFEVGLDFLFSSHFFKLHPVKHAVITYVSALWNRVKWLYIYIKKHEKKKMLMIFQSRAPYLSMLLF
jgi:hypothetical protein